LQAISSTTRSPNDRLVTISASPAPETGCEVDFPVVFLRQQRHRVQWQSQDKPYWISFLKLDEVIPGYTPENPLDPSDDPVVVPANSTTQKYRVQPKTKYYKYAIFDHDPTLDPTKPCKKASNDLDTGLNVKR